jgi:U3 small nucleolar RNA-associated protein 7
MVSAGQDSRMAIWDIRMFKEVNNYFLKAPASSIAISDTGLTAVGFGTWTEVWKGLYSKDAPVQTKVQSPYMKWGGDGDRVERVRWCPLEDVLGIGHDKGFASILIPGAGEANFDAMEVNPFETTKQRQEAEVKGLLNKLQPEMIALDPNFVGKLDLRSEEQRRADRDLDAPPEDLATKIRNKGKGRNSALKRFIRKQRKRNIIDEKKLIADDMWKEQLRKREEKVEQQKEDLGPALARFARKD